MVNVTISRARSVASLASASAASLCGIVTFTPRKPSAGRLRRPRSKSSDGSAIGT